MKYSTLDSLGGYVDFFQVKITSIDTKLTGSWHIIKSESGELPHSSMEVNNLF